MLTIPQIDACIADNNYVGNLISRNDDLHRFPETKEEWFVGLLRKLITDINDGELTPEAHEELVINARKKQTSYGEAVAQKPVVEMLIESWYLHRYFAHTDLYKPLWLRKMIGKSAAVSGIDRYI